MARRLDLVVEVESAGVHSQAQTGDSVRRERERERVTCASSTAIDVANEHMVDGFAQLQYTDSRHLPSNTGASDKRRSVNGVNDHKGES